MEVGRSVLFTGSPGKAEGGAEAHARGTGCADSRPTTTTNTASQPLPLRPAGASPAPSQACPAPAVPCCSYERDIKLAADVGSTTFRLSIEWARVEPERGVIDQQAVQRCAPHGGGGQGGHARDPKGPCVPYTAVGAGVGCAHGLLPCTHASNWLKHACVACGERAGRAWGSLLARG